MKSFISNLAMDTIDSLVSAPFVCLADYAYNGHTTFLRGFSLPMLLIVAMDTIRVNDWRVKKTFEKYEEKP